MFSFFLFANDDGGWSWKRVRLCVSLCWKVWGQTASHSSVALQLGTVDTEIDVLSAETLGLSKVLLLRSWN